MRLRTCRNEVMIQCDLCEVIRIINVSHAVGQTRLRNASEGCSGISFDQEFDCFRQGNKNYVSEVTRNCTGTQSCELLRGRAALNCSTLINTVSCCVEIFYTCEQRMSNRNVNPIGNCRYNCNQKFKQRFWVNLEALHTQVSAITNI